LSFVRFESYDTLQLTKTRSRVFKYFRFRPDLRLSGFPDAI
jgi:hypothetical protein